MQTLQDLVRQTVTAFVQSDTLFTALDVSNKVKETMMTARHRDVRDEVRNLFATDIEPMSWARTPIQVNLPDGTSAEALLYHPLSSSWDLDSAYDNQKRAQISSRPAVPVQAPVPATVAADGTVTVMVTDDGVTLTGTTITVAAPVAQQAAKDLWANMFQSQPSLFPLK